MLTSGSVSFEEASDWEAGTGEPAATAGARFAAVLVDIRGTEGEAAGLAARFRGSEGTGSPGSLDSAGSGDEDGLTGAAWASPQEWPNRSSRGNWRPAWPCSRLGRKTVPAAWKRPEASPLQRARRAGLPDSGGRGQSCQPVGGSQISRKTGVPGGCGGRWPPRSSGPGEVDYDLVLMDCQLPNMDAIARGTSAARQPGSRPPVPVIAMTAHPMAGDGAKCWRAE